MVTQDILWVMMMTMIYKTIMGCFLLMSFNFSVHAEPSDFSLNQAVEQAKQQGRVLSARTRQIDGHDVHAVKVLTDDGRVKRYRIDADTGRPYRRGQR